MKFLVRQRRRSISMDASAERRWGGGVHALTLTLLIAGLLIVYISQLDSNVIHPQSFGLRNSNDEPRALSTTDDDNPHFWKYAYVFVAYHKSGHHLSHTLRNYLQQDLREHFGSRLKFGHVDVRGSYDASTKCTELALAPGTITIIEAPEFQCHKEQLAKMMMNNPFDHPDPDTSSDSIHPKRGVKDPAHQKWGVKVIHLVRNPFGMAVSNYHFHAQDPTPEPFVHTANPCESLTKHVGSGGDEAEDLEAHSLEHPSFSINGKAQRESIMDHQDFDNIIQDCQTIYQQRPGFEQATYYDHLRKLDPQLGIRLSTTDKFNHIALMATDLLMFNRVREYQSKWKSQRPWVKHEDFNLITMTMDDWIEHPADSMYTFLQFMFHDTIPHKTKLTISKRYEDSYFKKMPTSNHVTTGKHSDTEELIEYLRRDEVFGGPLTRIEDLLNEMLNIEHQEILSRSPISVALATKREMTEGEGTD